ncbi:hypothetical protein, partial [Neisseria meningitidis]|uniref:hypothetical protein n=1 Tax=Neisseria meningitidis TaxID=487 RepID=UPI0011CE2E8E
ALPYYLYCLRLRRLVLIFVNPLYFRKIPTHSDTRPAYRNFANGPRNSKDIKGLILLEFICKAICRYTRMAH